MRGFLPAGRGISVALDLSPEQLKITSFMALLVKLELHRQQHPNRNWIFAAARRLKEPFLDRIHGCGIEIAKAGGLFDEHVADRPFSSTRTRSVVTPCKPALRADSG